MPTETERPAAKISTVSCSKNILEEFTTVREWRGQGCREATDEALIAWMGADRDKARQAINRLAKAKVRIESELR